MVGFAVLLATLAAWASPGGSAGTKKLGAVGSRVPKIALPDTWGKIVRISSFQGKVLLIQVLAAPCIKCNAETARLKEVWPQYRRKGVQFLGIGMYKRGNATEAVKEYVSRHRPAFPVIVDEQAAAVEQFSIVGTPTNVVVDRRGRIVYNAAGFDERRLFGAVDKALAAK